VNFYKHHIGDYAQATAHLSFVEDAAYSRLIRKYYADERPLPADVKAVQRLVGARSREEREAVGSVLEEFFHLRDDGWHNKRCDAEIAKAAAQADTNRRIAEEREAKRRARSEGEALHESLDEALHESCDQPKHDSLSSREPSQTPDSRLQTPKDSSPDGLVGRADIPPCPVEQLVRAYHEALPELPKVRLLGEDRRKALRALWRFALTEPKSDGTPRATTVEEALAWCRSYFERARENDWLMGRTEKVNGHAGWECDLDFLLSKKGMKHVIEKTREQRH
jgi:uncharacterized protein YdaU (DUF1376 family)